MAAGQRHPPRWRRLPHPRFSRFFAQIKQDLGFGIYVPDCDTHRLRVFRSTQAGSADPILDQPLLDFYAGYQVDAGANEPRVTCRSMTISTMPAGSSPGSTISQANGRSGNDLDPP